MWSEIPQTQPHYASYEVATGHSQAVLVEDLFREISVWQEVLFQLL